MVQRESDCYDQGISRKVLRMRGVMLTMSCARNYGVSAGFNRFARESSEDVEPSSRGLLLAAPMIETPPLVAAVPAGFTGGCRSGAAPRPIIPPRPAPRNGAPPRAAALGPNGGLRGREGAALVPGVALVATASLGCEIPAEVGVAAV